MAISATQLTDFDLTATVGSPPWPHVNPFSARGLRGTLTPINAAKGDNLLARTVNGTLINISAPQMHKYRVEITGNDQAPPALDGLWVGLPMYVYPHVEIAYLTTGGSPTRSVVPGSVRVEGNYTYYRPALTMMVVEWQIEREEWEQAVSWSLSLEEV
jgi:hypothetical protein